MTPLDQFKNMPKEPQLGDREKTKQNNEEYSAPLNVPLADQKAKLMSELYGVKPKNDSSFNSVDEKTTLNNNVTVEKKDLKGDDQDKQIDKKDNVEKLDSDSQYFPTLKNLYTSGHIDEKSFIETTKNLDSSKGDEGLDVLMKIVSGISDSKVRENIVKSFDKKEKTTEENFEKTEFFKDSTNLNMNLDKGVGGLELMLADNYVSVKNSDGTEDKQRDLSSSMSTTMNSILKNSSVDFKKQNGPLIQDIKSEKNLNKKYKLLKELYKEDLKEDAILGGKRSKEEINKKKNNLIDKAKDIAKQIKEAENITNEEKRKEVIDKLELEKSKIIEEGKEVDGFDAEVDSLTGGEEDIISE